MFESIYVLARALQTFISEHGINEQSLPYLKWDQLIKIIPQSMVGPAFIFFSKLENWQSQVCVI